MLYDITRTVSTQLAVWPGDVAYQVQPVLKIEHGHSVNLTTLIMSAHTGTHTDAYYHYQIDGVHPAEMPLEAYIGRAQVVTVQKGRGELLPEDFAHVNLNGCERLLIHSRVSDLPDSAWATKFVFLSISLIDWLAELGVRLIGMDSPSVDDFESKDLPCHHRLYQHGMVNLESLNLRGVPDGLYELIALPLKLDLACGSPVRAVLKTL